MESTRKAARGRDRPHRRLFRTSAIVLCTVALLIVGVYGFFWAADKAGVPLLSYAFDDKRFDQAAWRSKPDQRGPMTDDLIRRLRHGTPRADIRRLLGKPETEASGKSPDREDVYLLGSWSGFRGIDSDYLTIRYDSADRLVEAYHWQG